VGRVQSFGSVQFFEQDVSQGVVDKDEVSLRLGKMVVKTMEELEAMEDE
jgi:hypothetical protein